MNADGSTADEQTLTDLAIAQTSRQLLDDFSLPSGQRGETGLLDGWLIDFVGRCFIGPVEVYPRSPGQILDELGQWTGR